MAKTLFAFFMIISIKLISSCSQQGHTEPKNAITAKSFASPESVSTDRDFIYVSNVGNKLAPQVKDKDGFISLVKFNGQIEELIFLPENGYLNAPKGMVIIGGVLYVADVDHILGFDLKSRKKVFDLSFENEKTTFLNDLVLINDEIILVSATDINQIFEINLVKKNYKILQINAPIAGPNGLEYDKKSKKLYIASFGSEGQANGSLGLIYYPIKDQLHRYYQISQIKGHFDGLQLWGQELYFSDWVNFEGKNGKIGILNLKNKSIRYIENIQVAGPADFLIFNKQLYLPHMMEHSLSLHQVH